jgi:hypothetical protein
MDEFAVESKQYTIVNGVELPADWKELSIEQRIDYLFGEREL